MALFDNFPYTNFHDLNLDWLIKKFKDFNNTLNNFKLTASAKEGGNVSATVTGDLENGYNVDFTIPTTPLNFDRSRGLWNDNGTVKNEWPTLIDISLNDVLYNFRGYCRGTGINTPAGVSSSGLLDVVARNDGLYAIQTYSPYNEHRIFTRKYQTASGWSEWKEITSSIDFYSRLSGKKVVIVGDSLTAGHWQADDVPWIELLRDKYDMNIVNASISSSPISTGANQHSDLAIVDRAIAVATANTDADIFIIEGGANDFNYSTPISSVYDTVKTTYCGAINVIINRVRAIIPGVKLLFMTTYHRYDNVNSINLKEMDYVNAMIACCTKKSVPCFNNWSNCGISLIDSDGMTWADAGFVATGVRNHHFSKQAYEYLADIYAPFIANGYISNSKADIVLSNILLAGSVTNFNPTYISGTLTSSAKLLRFTIPVNKFIYASNVTFNTLFLTVREGGTTALTTVNMVGDSNVDHIDARISASGISVDITFVNALSLTNNSVVSVQINSSECVFS